MFGTGARFAEYGITGGFFLLLHVVVLGVAFPEIAIQNAQLVGGVFTSMVDKTPALAQPALQSLLIALALLSVFVTGLLLDLLGSVFVLAEARVFRSQIGRRTHWIENL